MDQRKHYVAPVTDVLDIPVHHSILEDSYRGSSSEFGGFEEGARERGGYGEPNGDCNAANGQNSRKSGWELNGWDNSRKGSLW